MAVIKGQNLRIKLGQKYVAFATNATVHIGASLEESSTKDSTNGWQQQEVTGMNWDISVDALYSVETDAFKISNTASINVWCSSRVNAPFGTSSPPMLSIVNGCPASSCIFTISVTTWSINSMAYGFVTSMTLSV